MPGTTEETASTYYDFGGYANVAGDEFMRVVSNSYRPSTPGDEDETATLQDQIRNKLLDVVDPEELKQLTRFELRGEVENLIEQLVDESRPAFNTAERRRLIEDLMDDIMGFGPLEKILRDPTVGDILVNGARQVYVERNGVLQESDVHFRNDEQVMQVIDRIVAQVGRRVDDKSPLVDARLPDGSRVNAIIPPLSLRGPTLSIRRFGKNALLLEDLVARDMFTEEMLEFLDAAVKGKYNVIISGGTGSGKTTLLNALSSLIPHNERIVTIEDAAELQLQQKHVVQLEARPANVEGVGEVTIRELMRNSLRMRPDRIVIGECRGGEALDMLQAMNTGHEGSMTTLHANSPRDALSRLENMVTMSGAEIPHQSLREQIASSINLIVQVDRLIGGARRLTSITEIVGMEGDTIVMQELFRFEQTGVNEEGKAYGAFQACGILPYRIDQIHAVGVDIHSEFFEERNLKVV